MIDRIHSLLTSRNHEVDFYFRDSSALKGILGNFKAAANSFHSASSRREIERMMSERLPDVVHVQNLYPLISPSTLSTIHSFGAPTVMRLSNYRLMCPNGLLLRKNKICELCVGGRELNCVLHNCENDIFKSTVYAARNAYARIRRFYQDGIDVFFAQTEFQRTKHVEQGIRPERIFTIPNMVEVKWKKETDQLGDFVAFVGRASAEKGIDTFVEAARLNPDIDFRVAGFTSENNTESVPSNISFVGHLDDQALGQFIQSSRIVVIPSLWYEGFPNSCIEAMAYRKTVIVSNIGGLPEVVQDDVNGRIFAPGDATELSSLIRELFFNRSTLLRLGGAAVETVKQRYSSELYYQRLIKLYEFARSLR